MTASARKLLIAALILVAAPAGAQQAPVTREISVGDAVRLAVEHNLGVRIARYGPQIEDLNVARALAAWQPTLTSTVEQANTNTPANSFLSGGQQTTDDRFASTVGVQQAMPWGGRYTVGWDSARSTTNNLFSNFSPQLRSSLSFHVEQPLLRDFGIDSLRQDVLLSRTNRDIADVDLEQTLATTTRTVRRAYWDLAYAIASLQVQRQSLDLARESLRNTRSRVEIGTTAPIDVIEAESEVATREEAVIVAQAQIETAEDALRALILDPAAPDYWSVRLVPSDRPDFQPTTVDVDGAVRAALTQRTDLLRTRKNLDLSDVSVRFFRNQTYPGVTLNFDYGLTGLGGTQFVRGEGFPGPIIGQTDRGFGSVLGDLFGNQFPSWTLGVNIAYPLGRSSQDANLARARIEYSQAQQRLRNQELQVTTQVREAARQVSTNRQRVQTTRASRELAERRLEAEEKKFAAGTSTSFFVFQAQRDLSQARNNELRAILDYTQSMVDLETIQTAPLTP